MTSFARAADAGVYLLADHLDAALAAGEDLLAASLAPPADWEASPELSETGGDAWDTQDPLRAFIADLRRFEASLCARILQARRRAAELGPSDAEFRPLAKLFATNTDILLDTIERLGDQGGELFKIGLDPYAFLRSRGLIGDDVAVLPRFSKVVPTEDYRVAGVLPLGSLLDLISTFLGTLDRRYDLYGEAALEEAREAVPHSEQVEPESNDLERAIMAAREATKDGGDDAGPPLVSTASVTAASVAEALSNLDRPS